MDRRAYLGGVAGAVASVCAGCVGGSGTSDAPAQGPNEDDTTAPEPTTRRPTTTTEPTDAEGSRSAETDLNGETPPTASGTPDDELFVPPSNTTTQKVIALGNGETITEMADGADSITVSNLDTDPRAIEVSIATESTPDDPLYHEEITFEPNAAVSFQVTEPATYRVVVSTTARPDTEPITFETDDCNDQSLSVGVRSDGSIESIATSTMMECVTWPF